MTIVKVSNETLESGKSVATYYSTNPFNLEEFIQEVGGLDGVIMTRSSFLGKSRRREEGEEAQLYDTILINSMMGYQPHLPYEQRLRWNYQIAEEIDGGIKIREIPATVLFEEDVTPELFTRSS